MNANLRNFALWVIIFLLVLALFSQFQGIGPKTTTSEITFSQLLSDVDGGKVRDVTIAGPDISGHYKDNRTFQTYAPSDPALVENLYKKDVQITARPQSDGGSWLMTIISSLLPVLIIMGFWFVMYRQFQGGAGKAMGFGKSKAKLLNEAQGPRDVRGRRGRRRGQGRPAGDRRIPEGPAEVPKARRTDSARRVAGRPSRAPARR